MQLTEIKFSSSRPEETDAGLIGWVSCALNGTIHLDGIAVRRTVDGRLTLSFPARQDSHGRRHFYHRPLDDCARREIEARVFRALGLGEGVTR